MNREASLQAACVDWFRLQHRDLASLLIHVPNGGSRGSAREGYNMKRIGVTAGVADLLLLVPRHGFGCLCIEMKAGKGKQRDSQVEWEQAARAGGNLYTVCCSVDEFMDTINTYLCDR